MKAVSKIPKEKKLSINSKIKATLVICRRRTFCRQRIPESSCARKATIERETVIISRNDERIIMQNLRITSGPPTRMRIWI